MGDEGGECAVCWVRAGIDGFTVRRSDCETALIVKVASVPYQGCGKVVAKRNLDGGCTSTFERDGGHRDAVLLYGKRCVIPAVTNHISKVEGV